MASDRDIVRALLDRHGRTFCEELGIDIARNTPSPLFRLLCAATLMSARINASIAVEAARNLAERGWRTPRKLAESTWEQRVKALNEAGYARYQERTATMLGDLTEHLLDQYSERLATSWAAPAGHSRGGTRAASPPADDSESQGGDRCCTHARDGA